MKNLELSNSKVTALSEIELKETSGGFIPLVAYIIFGIWSFFAGAIIAAAD